MIACDVLVVGAGPAGMAAAAAAAENGRRVCLLDQNAAAGGQIWRGYHEKHAANEPHGQVFAGLMGRLRSAGLAMRSEESVVAAVAQRVLRVESESRSEDIGYEQLILATGARERFLPFPGWTLPGVTGVGGLQALVKAGLPIAGKRVVLAGSGPLL
ncbi:MAG: FAD/NAD(P)-binding oxidoreductase, partial [Terracidiphilus sp.]